MIKRKFILLVSLFVLMGCMTNPVTGKKELMVISEATELSLGANAVPSVEYEYSGVYPESDINNYVNTIGQKLARVSHRPNLAYHYKVLNTSVINAFALPGGFVYITRGLLVKLTNEAQLAAVLGHETAHVAARHSAKQLQSRLGFQFLVNLALAISKGKQSAVASAQVSSVMFNVISLGYSREDEYEADELGLIYTYKAGYNPDSMGQLLGILKQMEKGGGKGMEFLSSHPDTDKRINEVNDKIKKKYPNSANLKYEEASFNANTQRIKQDNNVYMLSVQADKYLKDNNPKEAVTLYSQAITQLPNHPYFHTRRGLIYLSQNELKKASDDFSSALALNPSSYDALVGQGAVYLINKQYTQAQNELTRAIKLLPEHPAGHFYLGETYLGLGVRNQALEEYNAVMQLAPAESSYAKKAQQRITQITGKK